MSKKARQFIVNQIKMIGIAIVFGVIFSNFTSDSFDKLAVNIMKFVSGGALFSEKTEDGEIPKIYNNRLRKAFYNPLYIATRALDYYSNAIKKEEQEKYLKYFYSHVNWLKQNIKVSTHSGIKFGIWEYNFYSHYYKLPPPWRSGMAQGKGIMALYKAYELTGDDSYLEYAKYAMNAFFIGVKDGGVTYKDSENEWWYEEYAGSNGIESRVLNGAIYAVLDLYEYWKATGDTDAKILVTNGVNCIKKNLHRYDTGKWTYYDAIGTIATKHYHQDHIELVQKLYEISGDQYFLGYSHKWSEYAIPYFVREFLMQKPDYHDIVILGINSIGIFALANILIRIRIIIKRHKK